MNGLTLLSIFNALGLAGFGGVLVGWLARDADVPKRAPIFGSVVVLFSVSGINMMGDLPGPLLVWFAWPIFTASIAWRNESPLDVIVCPISSR